MDADKYFEGSEVLTAVVMKKSTYYLLGYNSCHLLWRWYRSRLIRPWRRRRYVPPKRQLTFNGLHNVISQSQTTSTILKRFLWNGQDPVKDHNDIVFSSLLQILVFKCVKIPYLKWNNFGTRLNLVSIIENTRHLVISVPSAYEVELNIVSCRRDSGMQFSLYLLTCSHSTRS
jgi:hypothetical protein